MAWAALLIFVAGALLSFCGPRAFGATPNRKRPSGHSMLALLALFASAYGVVAITYYWDNITQNADKWLLAIGLMLAMSAGMVTSVLAGNVRAGRPMLKSTASQLIYPMLFGPIVYYPTWTLVEGDAGGSMFFAYAAFVNGYCWERIVGDVRAIK